MSRLPLVVASLGLCAALAACDTGEPPRRKSAVVDDAAPAGESTRYTVSHILIKFKSPANEGRGAPVTRSKSTAKTIATSLQQDIVDGRMTFEEAMEKYTEDRGPDGKVNPPGGGKPGQYSFRMEDSFVPEFKEAGRTTPVGKLAPQPIETMFGYHLIRRDR